MFPSFFNRNNECTENKITVIHAMSGIAALALIICARTENNDSNASSFAIASIPPLMTFLGLSCRQISLALKDMIEMRTNHEEPISPGFHV